MNTKLILFFIAVILTSSVSALPTHDVEKSLVEGTSSSNNHHIDRSRHVVNDEVEEDVSDEVADEYNDDEDVDEDYISAGKYENAANYDETSSPSRRQIPGSFDEDYESAGKYGNAANDDDKISDYESRSDYLNDDEEEKITPEKQFEEEDERVEKITPEEELEDEDDSEDAYIRRIDEQEPHAIHEHLRHLSTNE